MVPGMLGMVISVVEVPSNCR